MVLHSRSHAHRTSRTASRLTVILGALSAHAFAADATHDATGRTPAEDIDTVMVLAQRYLPQYAVRRARSATRTDTPLLDVPQSITVVTDKLVADQGLTTLSDTFRYMPGRAWAPPREKATATRR
ncbi:MAG: hypothetical protein IPI06_00350 [Gammaproteobacteria bacterium]|nr:hypothetical protein [Gammaproteobacteria bacterium]